MRRLETETHHTRQATYFGFASVVSFLVFYATKWCMSYTKNTLPNSVIIFCTLLFISTTILCLFHAVNARREPASSSKTKMMFLAGLSMAFWVLILLNFCRELLGVIASIKS